MAEKRRFRQFYEQEWLVMADGPDEFRYAQLDKPVTLFRMFYIFPTVFLSIYFGWRVKKKEGWLKGLRITLLYLVGFGLFLQMIPWVREHEKLTVKFIEKYRNQFEAKPNKGIFKYF